MTGRDRRLEFEYDRMTARLEHHPEIDVKVVHRNDGGHPDGYVVTYNVRSICGADDAGAPMFADRFLLGINMPDRYPDIDSPAVWRFLTADPESGEPIPHPWHPNIRYFGPMAGRVCLNAADTYAEIAWGVLRVEQYLRYERYHAINEPPFPEDQQVAAWVVRTGEPNNYIYF